MKLDAKAFRGMKGVAQIPMLTAYTTPVARALEQAGLPIILVGDTLGMVEMGFDSTRHTTMAHMQYHIGAVRRGAPATHIVGDLPANSYEDAGSALANARLLLDAGADSVKLEGARLDTIAHLVANGVDVVGHTGLLPQTAANFRQVGRDEADARRILEDATGIAKAGAFMVVLEHVPAALAASITAAIPVPTIGIGAGGHCDGQVLVINDVLGLGDRWPPFSRQYAYLGKAITEAAQTYMREVRDGTFADNLQKARSNRTAT